MSPIVGQNTYLSNSSRITLYCIVGFFHSAALQKKAGQQHRGEQACKIKEHLFIAFNACLLCGDEHADQRGSRNLAYTGKYRNKALGRARSSSFASLSII